MSIRDPRSKKYKSIREERIPRASRVPPIGFWNDKEGHPTRRICLSTNNPLDIEFYRVQQDLDDIQIQLRSVRQELNTHEEMIQSTRDHIENLRAELSLLRGEIYRG
jgi:hypothetical protein